MDHLGELTYVLQCFRSFRVPLCSGTSCFSKKSAVDQDSEVRSQHSEVERSAVREERSRSEFHVFLSFDISPNDVKHVKVNIVCNEIEGCPILSSRLQ